jgi:surface lipoprotein assembly modifier-like protein
MKKMRLLSFMLFWIFPIAGFSQETANLSDFKFKADLIPLEFGFQFGDNVFQSPDPDGRLSDEIYLLNGGVHLNSTFGILKGDLDYHLGADQYQFYSALNNIKNRFDLLLAAEPGDFSFYYKKEYFIRDSQYDQFNYWDDDNVFGVQWNPSGPWNYEMKGKYFSRQYYGADPAIQAENFVDQGVLAGIGREIDERISVKLEGSYNNRQFDRDAVGEADGAYFDLPYIQTDETWSILFNAHLYFENILQDVNFEQQRTNSNSYGFSNTVQSVSWAGVVRPSPSIYLQLLFRLFSKTYDVQPLVNSDLHIGFIDEDSQDLLSLKATWEWAPQWSASISGSRFRNEYIQPGQYYIEDLLTATVQRNF